MPLDEAIASAVKQAVKNNIMKDFLAEHGSEVENMLFEEWDWEQYVATQRAEALEEGKAKMLSDMVHTMASSMQPDAIAATLELPLSQIQNILSIATDQT